MKAGELTWFGLSIVCLLYLSITYWTLPANLPIPIGLEGQPVSWFSRSVFVSLMLSSLIVFNGAFVALYRALSKGIRSVINRVPWRRYWTATPARRSRAANRARDVTILAGLFINATWLIAYHLVMQEVGESMFLQIPMHFGLYMIGVGTIALGYALIIYFKPP